MSAASVTGAGDSPLSGWTRVTERPLSPTLLDLRTVTGPELAIQRVFTPAQLDVPADDEAAGADHAEFRVADEVRFEGTVRKQEPRFHLTGRVQTTLEIACGRCLEPFRLPVDVEVDLTYVPDPTELGEAEVELKDEDLSTAYYRHQAIDLGDMLREQFYLALPMRPLCREECAGLCPHCGTNLNQGTCACEARWEDPRLAGLRALMKKSDGQH